MQVFQTKKQISNYISSKKEILEPLGYYCYKIIHDYYGTTVVWTKGWRSNNKYISVLLYSKFVGKGIVKAAQSYRKFPIITTKQCGIEEHLIKHEIPYILADKD